MEMASGVPRVEKQKRKGGWVNRLIGGMLVDGWGATWGQARQGKGRRVGRR